MNNKIKSIAAITMVCGWPALGFKRGLNSYDYNYSHNKLYKHHEKAKHPFYLDKFAWGIISAIAYLNPVTGLFGLYKEVYRLEVNLRGLEDEKKTDYYNEVL
jgi:hypothetical protein